MANNSPKTRRAVAAALATWFGCGYFPAAPGSFTSAVALAMAILLARYAAWQGWHFAVLAGVLLAPGIWAAHQEAQRTARKDPRSVVIDEVLGQWVTLAGALRLNWKSWLAAFLLFRILDIWKPAPARQFESLPGGIGIVTDDLAAGVYGALVLFIAGCFNLY